MNRISKDNTIMAAILTESGAPFNEKGVNYVKDMIVEVHPEMKDFPIIAMMGETVRKPYQLYALFQANPHIFIVESYNGGGELELFDMEVNDILMNALSTCAVTEPETTTWQMFNRKEDN